MSSMNSPALVAGPGVGGGWMVDWLDEGRHYFRYPLIALYHFFG